MSPVTTDSFRVVPHEMALLIVDVQERLAVAMPPATFAAVERNLLLLLELARRQNWPVVITEQYPKGLGATVASVRGAVGSRSDGVFNLEKLHFAATDASAFADVTAELGPRRWVVAGMEAHVCVYQTVRGLRAAGATVHVPEDAVVSRAAANQSRGLALMHELGAIITCSETVVFDALSVAGSDDFKALSRLIR